MKANKYAKLLSDTIAANSTAKFHETQLIDFSNKTIIYCSDLSGKFDSIHGLIGNYSDNPSLLQREQVDSIHKFIKDLEQYTKSLHKDVEKPILQYQKDLDKINKDLVNRILTTINACPQKCEFDLNLIKTTVQNTQAIISSCNTKIDLCLKEILRCQKQSAKLEQILRNLDLPNEIDQATKQVVKINEDLSRLNQQVLLMPNTKDRFQREFLPLINALENLRVQTKILAPEEAPSSKSAPSAPNLKT